MASLLVATRSGKARAMGRKRLWATNIRLPLADGMAERIKVVLREGETQVAFLQSAVERAVIRREEAIPLKSERTPAADQE